MIMDVWFWIFLGIMILSIVIEVSTTDLTSFWFALGALGALIASLCGAPWWLLLVIFSVISVLCIIFLRPLLKKKFDNATVPTNAEAAIGKVVLVNVDITPDVPGEIKFEGIIWTAVSEKPQTIKAGKKVEIVRINGNKMIVKPLN